MDHLEAVRLRAAERYVLKQLTTAEAEAFEEHFFSCPECAEEVRWIAMFEDNARKAVKAQEMTAEFAMFVKLVAGKQTTILIPEHVRQVILEVTPAAKPAIPAELGFLSGSGVRRMTLLLPEEFTGPIQIALRSTDLDPGQHRLRLESPAGVEEFPILIRID